MKSNKFFILTLMLITIFLFTIGKAEAVCFTPVEDGNINESKILCPGSYNLNDTNTNGGLIINASNIVLDGNGSTIYGNYTVNSRGVSLTSFSNVTIINLNVSRYYYGIYFFTGTLSNVSNNSLYNNTQYGIYMRTNSNNNNISNNNVLYGAFGIGPSLSATNIRVFNNSLGFQSNTGIIFNTNVNNSFLYGNFIYNNSNKGIEIDGSKNNTIYNNYIPYIETGSTTYGIRSYNGGSSNTYYNNTILGYRYGITTTGQDDTIYGNYIYNTNLWGISTTASNTRIYNNFVYNSSWNLIYIQSSNNSVYNNYLENYEHHGIDTHNDNNFLIANHSFIYNNTITKTDPEYDEGDAGIFLDCVSNFSVYNNYLYNLYNNNTIAVAGINIESPDNGTDNRVYNNRFRNITGIFMYDSANRTVWDNNTIEDSTSSKTYAWILTLSNAGSIPKYVTFNNNRNLNGTIRYAIANNNLVLNISGNDGYYINSSGNNFVNITRQSQYYPFNDVYNVSSASILSSNVDNYSITLTSGQQIIIGNYSFISLTLNSYPSGNLLYNLTGVGVNITDPDGIYNQSNIFVYDNLINVLQSYNNRSLNFVTNFTALDGGDYYARVIVYTNQSTIVDSGLLPFTIDYNYGVSNCTGNQHKVWQILPLIVLAGFLLYLLVSVEMGLFGMLGFLVTLVIELNLIANLIRVILTSC